VLSAAAVLAGLCSVVNALGSPDGVWFTRPPGRGSGSSLPVVMFELNWGQVSIEE
jgi:hypothetical protein